MKFLKYVEKWFKNVENDLEIWEMAKNLLYGSDTFNTALKSGFTMLEMA